MYFEIKIVGLALILIFNRNKQHITKKSQLKKLAKAKFKSLYVIQKIYSSIN